MHENIFRGQAFIVRTVFILNKKFDPANNFDPFIYGQQTIGVDFILPRSGRNELIEKVESMF